MRESLSALALAAGAEAGGAAVRARAVCVHAALKLAARLLRAAERRADRRALRAVSSRSHYVQLLFRGYFTIHPLTSHCWAVGLSPCRRRIVA